MVGIRRPVAARAEGGASAGGQRAQSGVASADCFPARAARQVSGAARRQRRGGGRPGRCQHVPDADRAHDHRVDGAGLSAARPPRCRPHVAGVHAAGSPVACGASSIASAPTCRIPADTRAPPSKSRGTSRPPRCRSSREPSRRERSAFRAFSSTRCCASCATATRCGPSNWRGDAPLQASTAHRR